MLRSLLIGGVVAGLTVAVGLFGVACETLGPAPTVSRATPSPRVLYQTAPYATPSPRPTSAPVGAGSAGCVGCHTDKEKLREVAAAEQAKGQVACKG